MAVTAKESGRLTQESVSKSKSPKKKKVIKKASPKKSEVKEVEATTKVVKSEPFGWLTNDGRVKVTIINSKREKKKRTIERLLADERISTHVPLEQGEKARNGFDSYTYMGVNLQYPKNEVVYMPKVINQECLNKKYGIRPVAQALEVAPDSPNLNR